MKSAKPSSLLRWGQGLLNGRELHHRHKGEASQGLLEHLLVQWGGGYLELELCFSKLVCGELVGTMSRQHCSRCFLLCTHSFHLKLVKLIQAISMKMMEILPPPHQKTCVLMQKCGIPFHIGYLSSFTYWLRNTSAGLKWKDLST